MGIGINRYIVGCKYEEIISKPVKIIELIDT